MKRKRIIALFVGLMVLVTAPIAHAHTIDNIVGWFPSSVGNQWVYQGDRAGVDSISGTQLINGVLTNIFSTDEGEEYHVVSETGYRIYRLRLLDNGEWLDVNLSSPITMLPGFLDAGQTYNASGNFTYQGYPFTVRTSIQFVGMESLTNSHGVYFSRTAKFVITTSIEFFGTVVLSSTSTEWMGSDLGTVQSMRDGASSPRELSEATLYYSSGLLSTRYFGTPNADGYVLIKYTEENYNGTGKGRIFERRRADSSYEMVSAYWDDTDAIKTLRVYDANSNFVEEQSFYQSGNLQSITPPPGSALSYREYRDEDFYGGGRGRLLREVTAVPVSFLNVEASAEITDPTPDGGGLFRGRSISGAGLLLLSDENEGADLVFQVFDQDPNSSTFGQWLGSIAAPTTGAGFGDTSVFAGGLLFLSSTTPAGNIVFHGFNVDRGDSSFLDLQASIEDPSPDGFFGNNFSARSTPFNQIVIRNMNASGAAEYNIFDADRNSVTFGQMIGNIESPTAGDNTFSLQTFFQDGRSIFKGTDALGKTQMYLFEFDPASPQFGDLLFTVSDPDLSAPPGFGTQYTQNNDYLILNGLNASGNTFYYAVDINRSSPTFGSFVATLADPDPATGGNFGSFFNIVGGLLLVGDDDGSGNGLAHIYDLRSASPTFGTLLGTFDFPKPPPIGFMRLFPRENLLFESEYVFTGTGLGTAQVNIYDLDPASPMFGQLLTSIVDPTPTTMNMSSFPIFFEDVTIFFENADGNFNIYVYNIDPTSANFGQLISTTMLPSSGGVYGGYTSTETGILLNLGNSLYSISMAGVIEFRYREYWGDTDRVRLKEEWWHGHLVRQHLIDLDGNVFAIRELSGQVYEGGDLPVEYHRTDTDAAGNVYANYLFSELRYDGENVASYVRTDFGDGGRVLWTRTFSDFAYRSDFQDLLPRVVFYNRVDRDAAGNINGSLEVRDFIYDAAGNRVSYTSIEKKADGSVLRRIEYSGATFDAFNRLASQTQKIFSASGQLLSHSVSSNFVYDPAGRILSFDREDILRGGKSFFYNYQRDSFGRQLGFTREDRDLQGNVIRTQIDSGYIYDGDGRVASYSRSDLADGLVFRSFTFQSFLYDDAGRITAFSRIDKDKNGEVLRIMVYDSYVYGADRKIVSYRRIEKDAQGNEIRRFDYSEYAFDENGRLYSYLSRESSGAGVKLHRYSQYTYDAAGRVSGYRREEIEDGVTTLSYVYSGKTYNHLGQLIGYRLETFNALGEKTAVTDYLECGYNSHGRIVSFVREQRDEAGEFLKWEKFSAYIYREDGKIESYERLERDASGQTRIRQVFTNFTYHANGKKAGYSVTNFDAEDRVTESFIYSFYESGNRKSIRRVSTGIVYDYYDEVFNGGSGRLSRRTNADGSYISYDSYWADTNRVHFRSHYSASGVLTVTYEIDVNGVVIHIIRPSSPAGAGRVMLDAETESRIAMTAEKAAQAQVSNTSPRDTRTVLIK